MGRLHRLALLLLLTGACDEEPSFSDAGVDAPPAPDATSAPDTAAAPDAQVRGLVTIDVRSQSRDGLPEIGAPVVFVDADGAVSRSVTDGRGKASAELTTGASVTVVWPRSDGARLVSVLDVEPGDEILLGTPRLSEPEESGQTEVTIAPLRGVAANVAQTSCGSFQFAEPQSATGAVRWNRDCEQADDDFLVLAYNEAGFIASYVYLGNHANAPHPASVTMPVEWQTPVTFQARLTNLPAGIAHVSARLGLSSGDRALFYQTASAEVPSLTSLTLELLEVPLAGDGFDLTTWLSPLDPQQQGYRSQRVRQRLPVGHGADLDVGATLLPFVTPARFDAAMREVSWTEQGTGHPDAQVITVSYSRPGSGKGQERYEWRVIAPGGTGAIVLPPVPAEVGEVAPLENDTIHEADVVLIATDTHDARHLRQVLGGALEDWLHGSGAPPSGQVVVSGVLGGK